MKTPKMKSVFESVYYGQVFKIGGVGYDVPTLTDWCKNNLDPQEIDLKSLTMSKSDEKHGSDDFKKHAKKVNYKKFPIVTVARNDGKTQIADGNHRAWSALEDGNDTILGYVVPEDELPAEAIVDAQEEEPS